MLAVNRVIIGKNPAITAEFIWKTIPNSQSRVPRLFYP